ncbi:MAG: sugar phosphate isomerase/epimerase [Capsulimonadales bacterium]|nr:sugar phosphate isomerase/epimerase [Capsulimonadales bacterium]
MYTVRDHTHTAADLAEALRRIAAIGYPAVQLSAVGAMNGESPAVTAKDAARMLADRGLKCIATHRSWERLARHTDEEIEFHGTLDCGYVAIGGIPGEYGAEGADGYRRFVEEAAPVVERLRAAGIGFGHHNHAHEFERFDAGNPATLFDILIDDGGPDYLLEVDVYWAWHAGVDPSDLLRRCSGRVPVIHLKDKEVVGGKPEIGAIGEGNLPWRAILGAGEEAGVAWYCIEQDTCRRDPFDCLASSFRYLSEGNFPVRTTVSGETGN